MATVEQSPMILKATTAVGGGHGTPDEQGRSWLLLGMTEAVNGRVEELALRTGDSKADVFNKALALYWSALEAIDEGNRVGVAGPGQELETELIGY